jgi:hypothetical protein
MVVVANNFGLSRRVFFIYLLLVNYLYKFHNTMYEQCKNLDNILSYMDSMGIVRLTV